METILTLTDFIDNSATTSDATLNMLIQTLNSIFEKMNSNQNSIQKLTLNHNISQNLASLSVTVSAKLVKLLENKMPILEKQRNIGGLSGIMSQSSINFLDHTLMNITSNLDQLFNWFLVSNEKKKTKTYILTTLLYSIDITEKYGNTG